jgi:hypothetical protein
MGRGTHPEGAYLSIWRWDPDVMSPTGDVDLTPAVLGRAKFGARKMPTQLAGSTIHYVPVTLHIRYSDEPSAHQLYRR